MSLRRPTVACTAFIFCYKPFMWCRPDTRLWHYYSCSFRSRSHSDTRLAPVLLFLHFPLEESFRHSFGTSIYYPAFSARGVFQTLAWHQYYYSAVSARGVIQTLAWHPVFYFELFLTTCVHLGFRAFSWQTCDHIIIRSMFWFIIPVFLMFASTFKHTRWLVPGYCLGQIFEHGDKHRGDSLGTYVLTIAASRR